MSLKIGYAAGAFDLFHVGHLNILKHAKSECDYLIAGVVSDEMLELTKGITPVIPLAERLEIVSNIKFVDEARAEVHERKLDTWRDVHFDVFFKGDDWRGTEKGRHLEEELGAVGVEVVYFPYTVHTSSTRLRQALDAIDKSGAARRSRTTGPHRNATQDPHRVPSSTRSVDVPPSFEKPERFEAGSHIL
jgi:glycerol-3-phosphate cytidylyltransferase